MGSAGTWWDNSVCRHKEKIMSSGLGHCKASLLDPESSGGLVWHSLRQWICCQKLGIGDNICV